MPAWGYLILWSLVGFLVAASITDLIDIRALERRVEHLETVTVANTHLAVGAAEYVAERCAP